MFAPIIILGTTQAATRPKALWVGGVDMIKQSTYAAPIEDVLVDHVGPGGVSSMEFTVECTTVPPAVVIADDMDVRFHNNTKGWSDFYGFVDHVDIENMPGNRGTRYRVKCTGIEAVLDWSVMPSDLVVPAGLRCDAAAQLVFANATGTSLNRLHAGANGTTNVSDDTYPVSSDGSFTVAVRPNVGIAFTITAGTTLRQALLQVVTSMVYDLGPPVIQTFLVTVDFLGGLRFFDSGVTAGGVAVSGADQWGFPEVDNDPPYAVSSVVGENTTYGIDAAQVRAVLVKGTGVTQMVADGTGKEGPIAVLVDSTVTTQAQAITVGTGYLAAYATAVRGSFGVSDNPPFTGATQPRPGGVITNGITDQRLGLSSYIVLTTQITKTYNPSGRENWVVSFGGIAPSMTDLTRQLTRTTLS